MKKVIIIGALSLAVLIGFLTSNHKHISAQTVCVPTVPQCTTFSITEAQAQARAYSTIGPASSASLTTSADGDDATGYFYATCVDSTMVGCDGVSENPDQDIQMTQNGCTKGRNDGSVGTNIMYIRCCGM